MATIGFPGSYPEQASSRDAFKPLPSAAEPPQARPQTMPQTRPRTESRTESQTEDGALFRERGQTRDHAKANASATLIRRQPTPLQGRALETLGRAVEYLVDSYVFVVDGAAAVDGSSAIFSQSQAEAVQILMRLSREVFAECREVVPLHRRLLNWSLSRLSRAKRPRS